MDPDRFEQVPVESASQLQDWLDRHHAQDDSIWLVTWKKGAGPYVSRDEVLDALLAYGWIDGRRMARTDGGTMQLISPRRHQRWTQTYRDRVVRLTEAGEMRPAGLAAVRAAQDAGTWKSDADVDSLIIPPDLQSDLDKRGASEWFATAAPSYRRNVLRFLKAAKTEPTRRKRITLIAQAAAEGLKLPNY